MASGDTKTEQLLDALENGGDVSKIIGCCNTNLQNYLIESIDSLNDAKDVITEKGGTVGDTGLAGLADEIESIPSGGGEEDWGTVVYLDDNNEEQTLTIQSIAEYMEMGRLDQQIKWNTTIDGVTIRRNKITEVHLGKSATFIPDDFMALPNYEAPGLSTITGLENVVFIGESFLSMQKSFNQPINLPNVEYIDFGFLYGCTDFNQPIVFGKKVEIGTYFLSQCSAFNNSIDYNNIESFGTYFLDRCTSFNQIIPPLSNFGTVVSTGFLNGCASFNQALDLTGIGQIRDYFLSGCTAFDKSLTIPDTIISSSSYRGIGGYFMYNCKNFVGPLVCNAPTATSDIGSSNYSLATDDAGAAIYTTGVTLTGSYKNIWKNRFSDRTSSPYRKLILGS